MSWLTGFDEFEEGELDRLCQECECELPPVPDIPEDITLSEFTAELIKSPTFSTAQLLQEHYGIHQPGCNAEPLDCGNLGIRYEITKSCGDPIAICSVTEDELGLLMMTWKSEEAIVPNAKYRFGE